MGNLISKINRPKNLKMKRPKKISKENWKIKRRLKEDARKHNIMQCAHTRCLTTKKIS
jgi:hypothetical protein